MVELSAIYSELAKQQASVFVYPIGFAKASTIEVNGKYGVFLDTSHLETTASIKQLLAHECGHCATGATHTLASKWDLVAKHEFKANRWAYETFLPFSLLHEAVQSGINEPWQLAEYFDMPESFIRGALQFYTSARELTF